MKKIATHVARLGHMVKSTQTTRAIEAAMLTKARQSNLNGAERYNALQRLYGHTPGGETRSKDLKNGVTAILGLGAAAVALGVAGKHGLEILDWAHQAWYNTGGGESLGAAALSTQVEFSSVTDVAVAHLPATPTLY